VNDIRGEVLRNGDVVVVSAARRKSRAVVGAGKTDEHIRHAGGFMEDSA
jgi:hypothetical protein